MEDFETVYQRANELDVVDEAGNMIEVNWPDVATFDRSVIGEIEEVGAGDDGTTLYLSPRR